MKKNSKPPRLGCFYTFETPPLTNCSEFSRLKGYRVTMTPGPYMYLSPESI